MPQVLLDNIPDTERLPIKRTAELLGIKRNTVYKHFHYLVWAEVRNTRRGPKSTRVVDARSLPPEATARHLQSLAAERMAASSFFNRESGTPKATADRPEQPDLFLGDIANRMPGEYEQKRVADRRLRFIEPVANGLYRKLGYQSKGDYLRAVAVKEKVPFSTLNRWWAWYRNAGQGLAGLQALMNDRPGPEASGPNLEPWQKLFLDQARLVRHITREKAYEELLADTAGRQGSWGVNHIYQQPTRSSCFAYWASLAPKAETAAGRSALKQAEMQISRTYADCYSLDRVGTDEWIVDVMSYDPNLLVYPKGHKKAGQVRTGRYYLVTMLDERSLYPLEACLCEFPNKEDEIDLLVSVCMSYGVPGLINADRGRFRGKVFGGQFRVVDRDAVRGEMNGILEKLNIGRNMPREHNPQGNRLERFHLELAREVRVWPGWLGADTRERQELSNADPEIRQHEEWVKTGKGSSPLLSRDELLERFRQFFGRWRNQQSEGTDMNHLTPAMVLERNRPPGGFRAITPAELDRATARVWPDKLIESGVVTISEGNYLTTKYYSHELVLPWINGQRFTVTRSRYDRSKITVHGVGRDGAAVVVPAMPRVGTRDPELLSEAIAEKTFSRNLIRQALPVHSLESKPPSSRERINPEEFIEERTISSMEWKNRRKARSLPPVTSEERARLAWEIERGDKVGASVAPVDRDRETARQALRVYMSRTGLALNQVADLTGFAYHSLRQFVSAGRYGDGEGKFTAQALMKFMKSRPLAPIQAPGKLYETECTRAIRAMVKYVRTGRWGTLYGPAGSQKTFGLESIAAETADSPEPVAVYVECSPKLTPSGLLRRISTCLGTPFAQAREAMLQALLFTIRQRRLPLALMIDEAQHLYRAVDTLETVRDVGDKARGRVGVLMAGNEDVLRLFEPRRGVYFEQWRSRIEQKTVRLTGLTGQECRQIVAAELGQLRPETVAMLIGNPVIDPDDRHHYYSARRLFHAIRDFRDNATPQ